MDVRRWTLDTNVPELPPCGRATPGLGPCDVCGVDAVIERKCKVICRNCGTILKSCADL